MRFLWFSLVACGTWLAASSPARAAFVYDLRFEDGSKSTVAAANTTYTLQLWGQITGDADKTNDIWQSGYVSLDAVKVGGGAFSNPGNLSTVGVTGAALGSHTNNVAVVGTQRTAPFLDNLRGWGGSSNSVSSGWLLWRGGTPPAYQGGVFDSQSVNLGANGQEVLLATFTVQTGANLNLNGSLGDATQFALRTQNTLTSGVSTVQSLLYGNDTSNNTLLNMTTGSVNALTSVSFLAPAAVPEPGTLALGGMLVAGLAGLKLRRKKA